MALEQKCPICGESFVWARKDLPPGWRSRNPTMMDLMIQHYRMKHPESGGAKLMTRGVIWVFGLFMYFGVGFLQLVYTYYGDPGRYKLPTIPDGPSSIWFIPNIAAYLCLGILLILIFRWNTATLRKTWKAFLKEHKLMNPKDQSGLSGYPFSSRDNVASR